VLDIAAGGGRLGASGIAPDADLIAVHLATENIGSVVNLGTSVTVFEALHFLDEAAGDRPLVINMSVGSHGDAHAGVSLLEQAIDHLGHQEHELGFPSAGMSRNPFQLGRGRGRSGHGVVSLK